MWSSGCHAKVEKTVSALQDYVDKQCVGRMDKLVPVARPSYKNAGALRRSVQIENPGRIVYTAPRARHDYYATVNHRHGGNKNARRLWFEVMKRRDGGEILSGAQEIIEKESK